jgi:hypothetical protein
VSHMVIFRTPEGKPGYQPAETVEDAVAVVERLRNDEGVENVRIFRLEELSFEYRPYYKVELAGVASSGDGGFAPPVPAIDEVGEAFASATDDSAEMSDEGEAHPDDHGDGGDHHHDHADEPVAQDHSAEHPPWAAPPPPPPPPGAPGADGPFGAPGDSADDEFSSAGQRRGLFGR